MRVEYRGAEQQQESCGGDRERVTPAARERSAIAADVADKDHLHAQRAELAEGGDQRCNPNEGAILAAAEGAPDEDEIKGLRGHTRALACDHPERAATERFLEHGC